MPTADAVTGAKGIPVGYTVLALTYVVVGLGVAWMLRRLARVPLELEETAR
jgi:cytochrome d ubiquinol oxidase subunit I